MPGVNILALSYYFPPMIAPRAVQVSRLLSALDADVTVLCGTDTQTPLDKTWQPDSDKSYREVRRIGFKRSKLRVYVDDNAQRRRFQRINQPDVWHGWNLKAFREYMKNPRPGTEVLLTFGNPMSDNEAGLWHSRSLGIPWIAHFSDPWVDNPFRSWTRAGLEINSQMERQVVEQSDALVFTSPDTIGLVMKKYPPLLREKAFYVPHCYDKSAFDASAVPPPDRYIIRYVGNFYQDRTPAPLYRAVETIAAESPQLLDGVQIEIVGSMEESLKTIPDAYPLATRYISTSGQVSYRESLNLMKTSHCLLVIDAPFNKSVFFPSKLVDYLGAERFILGITPPGMSERIIRGIGCPVVNPGDDAATTAALKDLLKSRPDKPPSPSQDFSKESAAAAFMNVIEYVLKRGAGNSK